MLENPTVVVLRDTAKREAERGWSWRAATMRGRLLIVVPDPVFRQLKVEQITPFSINRAAAEDFFERIQSAVAKRIQESDAGADTTMVLAMDDLR